MGALLSAHHQKFHTTSNNGAGKFLPKALLAFFRLCYRGLLQKNTKQSGRCFLANIADAVKLSRTCRNLKCCLVKYPQTSAFLIGLSNDSSYRFRF